MKAVVTGANGTLGQVLTERLKREGWRVIPWNRDMVPANARKESELFLQRVKPDVVYHLAIASRPSGAQNEGWHINHDWPAQIAELCRNQQCHMVYTSTAMVFSDHAKGPFTADSVPDAGQGYGYEKRMAEEAVRRRLAAAHIVRLGWQIGNGPGGNNMVEHLRRQHQENGRILASRRWLPACSTLTDSSDLLISVLSQPGATYMIDSNRRWTFYDIARAINERYGFGWEIEANDDFIYDQRMQDERLPAPPLSAHFPLLAVL